MSDRRAFRQQQYDTTGQLVSTGSANAYAVRGARPVTGYSAGLFLTFFPNFTNTGAATLAYGDLGAKSIKKTGTPSALVANDVVSGTAAQVLFDATNDCWQLLNPQASTAANSNKLGGLPLSSSGDRWGVVPFVHTDGVMEIGASIDYHNSDADTGDYANRLSTNGGVVGLYEQPNAVAVKRIVSLTDSTLAAGDIIYFDGTNFVRLAKATDGNILTQASGLPSWADPSSTGGISTIASGSLPSASTLAIANIPSTYSYLVLHISGISSNTSTRQPFIRVSTDNGTSYDSTAANYVFTKFDITTPVSEVKSTQASLIDMANSSSAGDTWDITLNIYGYHGGPFMQWNGRGKSLTLSTNNWMLRGIYIGSTSAINALQILWSGSGNFDAGTYALYGVS